MITYNHEEFVQQAVHSIVNQQCKFSFELIIGDDLSTDETRSLLLTLQAKYPSLIRLVLHGQNIGMNQNLAKVIELSRGRFLAFCEGDDYWQDPHKLRNHAEHLQAHPDLSMVCSDYGRTFLRDGKWYWIERTVPDVVRANPEISLFSLLAAMHIHLSAMMAPAILIRDYLASEYYDPWLSLGDVPLFLYLATRGQIRYLDGSVSTYRQHSASVTNRSRVGGLRVVKAHAAVVEKFASRFCEQDQYRLIKKAMRERVAAAAYRARSISDYLPSMDMVSLKSWLRLGLMLVPSLHERRMTTELERQLKSMIAQSLNI